MNSKFIWHTCLKEVLVSTCRAEEHRKGPTGTADPLIWSSMRFR